MKSLSRSLRSWTGKARKIEIPFAEFDRRVDFRTGDIAILAGAPGGGKSLVSVNWAWLTNDPVVYLAQDSPRSVMKRFVAVATGSRIGDIREENIQEWARMVDGRKDNLVISTGAHSLDDLEEILIAYKEWQGETPKVMFVDNLIDMRLEGNSHMENSFYAKALPQLKQLAIKYDVGLVLLHHVIRGDGDDRDMMGMVPLTLGDLLFAGEREARHVWGVYNDGLNFLTLQVLKQQDGRAHPGGGVRFSLDWTPTTAQLWDRT
jgi:hypothetical protein